MCTTAQHTCTDTIAVHAVLADINEEDTDKLCIIYIYIYVKFQNSNSNSLFECIAPVGTSTPHGPMQHFTHITRKDKAESYVDTLGSIRISIIMINILYIYIYIYRVSSDSLHHAALAHYRPCNNFTTAMQI